MVKKNYKMIMCFVLGMIVSGVGVYAAVTLPSSEVSYNNSTSGMNSTTVQAAIDELYTKAKNSSGSSSSGSNNIVKAYIYNSSSCTTGNESGCQATTCYQNKAANSCAPGTIIDYKVNNTTQVRFHVLHDDGAVMTLQSQAATTTSSWSSGSNGEQYNNKYGPLNALPALEKATTDWTNVQQQTYSIGDGSTTLGYSGCSSYNTCSTNRYSLNKTGVRARMITVKEASQLGCTNSANSCPAWLSNSLDSSSYTHMKYWTMSTDTDTKMSMGAAYSTWYPNVYTISYNRSVSTDMQINGLEIRAVVVISK